jgi:creatinine amidohydrolase
MVAARAAALKVGRRVAAPLVASPRPFTTHSEVAATVWAHPSELTRCEPARRLTPCQLPAGSVRSVSIASRGLETFRAPQVAERLTETSILVLPVGATEQHGPHLPFNTDAVIAESVAEATVSEVGDAVDAWLLPPLRYTKSNEHAWSGGTFWLSARTLLAVLEDLGRCVAATPAHRLVFLNGHGGNTALLNVACRELRLQFGLQTFLAHPSLPPDHGGSSPAEELGMGIHGGLDETSVMLHLRPDLVDLDAAFRNVPEALAENRYVGFGRPVSFGWLSNDFGPAGHIGDPTGATADRGKGLFEGAVRAFGEALAEVARFDFGRP